MNGELTERPVLRRLPAVLVQERPRPDRVREHPRAWWLAVGVATTTDLLVAQEQLLDAELARARALTNVRLADARLQRALGRP